MFQLTFLISHFLLTVYAYVKKWWWNALCWCHSLLWIYGWLFFIFLYLFYFSVIVSSNLKLCDVSVKLKHILWDWSFYALDTLNLYSKCSGLPPPPKKNGHCIFKRILTSYYGVNRSRMRSIVYNGVSTKLLLVKLWSDHLIAHLVHYRLIANVDDSYPTHRG